MAKKFVFLFLGAVAFITACGSSSSENKSEAYSYEMELNGCKTEHHAFSSLQGLCDGLKSQSLNHGCAVSMRESYFKQNCSGQVFALTD